MNSQNEASISVNNIAGIMCKAIEKEIDFLIGNNILKQHQKEDRSAYVLNKILQEHTVRYILLKAFYEFEENMIAKFDTEVDKGEGPIDLVFYESENKFAFEIKRWQKDEHKVIKEKDLKKLESFRKQEENSSCYELIFTSNEKEDVGGKDFEDPEVYYKKVFEDTFRDTRLELREHKVIQKKDFIYCIYLAELK